MAFLIVLGPGPPTLGFFFERRGSVDLGRSVAGLKEALLPPESTGAGGSAAREAWRSAVGSFCNQDKIRELEAMEPLFPHFSRKHCEGFFRKIL